MSSLEEFFRYATTLWQNESLIEIGNRCQWERGSNARSAERVLCCDESDSYCEERRRRMVERIYLDPVYAGHRFCVSDAECDDASVRELPSRGFQFSRTSAKTLQRHLNGGERPVGVSGWQPAICALGPAAHILEWSGHVLSGTC